MSVRFGLLTFLLIAGALGDLYLQSPRGSNDRLNEANTNRNNANRLFDSQNNAKGGYCYGPMMSFYEGSLLSVEWTNQHGCSNPKLYCNLVLQYMCGATTDDDSVRVRDGTTTNTIEDDPTTYNTKDANGDFVYGMHESYEFYQQCKTRERNMGLWISDREEEGGLSEGRRASVFTRQNNNGNRHGFECPEERDYYPYWQATPWRDIAVITDHPEWCDFYQTESQNVKGRNYCAATDGTFLPYIFQNDCTSNGGTWQSTESWGIAKPDCVQAPWGRDNQLGHALGGFNAVYNWTLPTSGDEKCIKEETCECVLRIRYNISSYDSINNQPYGDAMTDYKFNAANSPVFDDPIVDVKGGLGLKLALDTTQYGRTFQDRSYVFGIKPRPSGVPATARIWNLNVRGKRGNIVQTYPATEYDFVPQYLNIKVSDYVHFQWTGCDTNPAGNAGEGTDQTDRSNVVQMADPNLAAPASDDWLKSNAKMFSDDKLRVKLAYLGQTDCPTYDELLAKNNNNENQADQDPTNCHKLNAAPAYYDAGLVQFKSANTYHYMSTRNHNFTNRDQKGSLAVEAVLSNAFIAVAAVGGALFAASIGVAGAMFYAKSHPSSGVANLFNKM